MTDTARLLSVMTQMSLGPNLASVLADLGEFKFANADEEHWVLGPLVVHNSPWMDTLPDWAKRQALAERWLVASGELPGHVVGPTEMMCVMYPAVYEAPLRSGAANLYLWSACHAVMRHYGADSKSAKSAREVSEHVTDEHVLKEGGRLCHDYRHFAHEIRSKVVKARQQQLREAKRAAKATSVAAREIKDEPAQSTESTQYTLFE